MTLAFVFPGQGAQSVGMMESVIRHRLVRAAFEEAGEALGEDLLKLVQEGPKEVLDRTENTQPVLVAASTAFWRLWQDEGLPMPDVLAGHSLGEYSALVAAESLCLADAACLVRLRGRLMQESGEAFGHPGKMAAVVGLEDEVVESICREASGEDLVQAANYNAPRQVVISGDEPAVERAVALARQRGAKLVVPLAVSVAAHSSRMQKAAETLALELEKVALRLPKIPVLHNAGNRLAKNLADLRGLLAQQVKSPVRWVEAMGKLRQAGADTFCESGPGKVLSGLGKRIDASARWFSLGETSGFAEARQALSKMPREAHG
mgnify:CR=1 FL=1